MANQNPKALFKIDLHRKVSLRWSDLVKSEPRTLPSGMVFQKNKCLLCGGSWDTEHPRYLDEDEFHLPTCPLNSNFID